MSTSCTLLVTAAPLTNRVAELGAALTDAGWEVATVATPNAAAWLDEATTTAVKEATGWAPRTGYLPPGLAAGPAGGDALVICPATFNTINKAALGIADNHAHTAVVDLLGAGTPTVMVPMVTTKMWGHPAWQRHTDLLTEHGVRFLDPYTGAAGLVPMQLGTAGQIASGFDPAWLVTALAEITGRTPTAPA